MKKDVVQTGKCPNCGTLQQINISKKQETCSKCKFLFDVKDALVSYNIYQKAKEQNEKISNFTTIQKIDYLKEAEYELNLNNYAKAMNFYEKALEENSQNAQAWFGLVKCQTKRFTDYEEDTHEEELYKALALAEPEEKQKMLDMYDNYISAREKYESEKEKLDLDRIEMFKDSRAKNLNKNKLDLQNNFRACTKVENILNILTCIIFALLFAFALIFGGLTVFASSRSILEKIISALGIVALGGVMAYYIYTRFMFTYYADKLCKEIFNQEEDISNLAKLIRKNEYQTLQILTKMHYKNYIPGFNLYKNQFLLYDLDALNIVKKEPKSTKSEDSQITQKTSKKDQKLDKIDKILNKTNKK